MCWALYIGLFHIHTGIHTTNKKPHECGAKYYFLSKPQIWYPTNLGVLGMYISSVFWISNPHSANKCLISLVKWHPSAKIFQIGSIVFWNFFTFKSGDLECSEKMKFPPFFKTRLISLIAYSGFGIEHNV